LAYSSTFSVLFPFPSGEAREKKGKRRKEKENEGREAQPQSPRWPSPGQKVGTPKERRRIKLKITMASALFGFVSYILVQQRRTNRGARVLALRCFLFMASSVEQRRGGKGGGKKKILRRKRGEEWGRKNRVVSAQPANPFTP